jgi:hypothetical protein
MRTPIAAATLAAAALPIVLAGPAHAELYGIDDPEDTHHGSDVLSLSVRNAGESIDVTTQHLGLRRDPDTGSAGRVYLDTDRRDRGPEYVFVGGFYAGTDYTLMKTEGFARKQWGHPLRHADYLMKVDYREETVRFRIHRPGVGNPDEVRVAVRVSGTRTDGTSHGLVDWVGKKHGFTPWIDHN